MYLKLDNLEIKEKNLLAVIINGNGDLLFEGRALEEEGKKIWEELQNFEEDQIVEVEFQTRDSFKKRMTILRIKEIKTPKPEMVAPVIYRFSGRLERVK